MQNTTTLLLNASRIRRGMAFAVAMLVMTPLSALATETKENCDKVPKAFFEQFDDVSQCQSVGLIAVKQDEQWGYIDSTGKMVVPFVYEGVYDVEQGVGIVRRADKYGMVNPQGKLIVPLIYDDMGSYHDWLFMVKKD